VRSRRVLFRPTALADIEAIFAYLAERAGPDVAAQFFDAAFASADDLATFPSRGRLSEYPWAVRLRLRTWPVKGFEAVSLFYRSGRGQIEVIRVLDQRRSLGSDSPP
jgi:plasmid stabilization system protein ParE